MTERGWGGVEVGNVKVRSSHPEDLNSKQIELAFFVCFMLDTFTNYNFPNCNYGKFTCLTCAFAHSHMHVRTAIEYVRVLHINIQAFSTLAHVLFKRACSYLYVINKINRCILLHTKLQSLHM